MNLLEENEVLEKNKDDYELLGITWGKYYQKSFVFHVFWHLENLKDAAKAQ